MSMIDLVATRRDTIGASDERYSVSGTDSTTIDTERQPRTATGASAHARAGARRAAVVPPLSAMGEAAIRSRRVAALRERLTHHAKILSAGIVPERRCEEP